MRIISGLDPARQAFEDAVNEFRKEISEEECSKWLKSATTISDVEDAVISAKEKYEKKSAKSRARKWLASCSSRLMYYSVIMDTLSQHHPEYVSLAWGALKFLFIVSNATLPVI
jgi:chromosomal replication initiation ATPase DnaA